MLYESARSSGHIKCETIGVGHPLSVLDHQLSPAETRNVTLNASYKVVMLP